MSTANALRHANEAALAGSRVALSNATHALAAYATIQGRLAALQSQLHGAVNESWRMHTEIATGLAQVASTVTTAAQLQRMWATYVEHARAGP
ncbi:MAG: hypothetical protein EOO41_04235 [Methanobacteriota archaeon]|nr:MAG: hypothetical protein EOO41_04235 [Euryarchaeota archaeon]